MGCNCTYVHKKLKSLASFDKTRVIALTTSFSIKRNCVKTILLKIAGNNNGNNLKEQKLKTLIWSIAVNIRFSKYKIINNKKIMILKSGDLPELSKIYWWLLANNKENTISKSFVSIVHRKTVVRTKLKLICSPPNTAIVSWKSMRVWYYWI